MLVKCVYSRNTFRTTALSAEAGSLIALADIKPTQKSTEVYMRLDYHCITPNAPRFANTEASEL